MNIEVANRLAELRKLHGLSQEQLAEQLGISRQAVSKWERAESAPDTDNLIALSRLYQVTLDELITMSPEAESDEQFAARVALEAKLAREARGENVESAEAAEPAPDPVRRLYPTIAGKPMNWYAFPYPVIVVIVFVLLGTMLDIWHPAWLLFLTIPMYYTAIEGDHFNLNKIPFPLMVVPIFLIMGFAWDLWHPGWLIFLTIPIYYTVMYRRIETPINMILMAVMGFGLLYLTGCALTGVLPLGFLNSGVASSMEYAEDAAHMVQDFVGAIPPIPPVPPIPGAAGSSVVSSFLGGAIRWLFTGVGLLLLGYGVYKAVDKN